MSLPATHMMSYLQYAYVDAVVARAGATCTPYAKDYGLDARISQIKVLPDGSHITSGIGFDCQLKATTGLVEKDNHFIFRLGIRNYNILAEFRKTLGILIVFKMPKQPADWLSQSDDMLCLRECCYWTQIPNKPIEGKLKRSKVPVKVPYGQIFDANAVTQLLSYANGGVGASLGD